MKNAWHHARMYMCIHTYTYTYIHHLFLEETYSTHMNSILVFQPPPELHCPLTLLFYSTNFYCTLIWERESSRNPQVGMQDPAATWSFRKAPFPSHLPNLFYNYNLNVWTTEVKHANFPKKISYCFHFKSKLYDCQWIFCLILRSQDKKI